MPFPADDSENDPDGMDKNRSRRDRTFSLSSKLVPITDDYDEYVTTNMEKDKEAEKERIKVLMEKWRNVARRVKYEYVDPWDQFHIQEYPIQRAKRYLYSAIRKKWSEDFVEVRLHPESFARGAMRECYRLKKRSSLGGNQDWSTAQNYVAKRYINQVDRRVLFDDVRLQMDAKLWAEEYNRHNPPKKIDIVQMCVIELVDVENSPLYHLEHFIEGKYLKYNSNSGFVSNDARLTPQAFSHFTFERSGHQMMVVDIQGVGDLYTDPQIHTVIGTDYGDGNLGTRGMALFFHSHRCNHICKSMDLSSFELSPPEFESPQIVVNKGVEATAISPRRMRMSSECAIVENGISMDELRRRTTFTHSASDISCKNNDDCICMHCVPTIEQLVEPLSDDEDEEEEEGNELSDQDYNDDLPLSIANSRNSCMSFSTRSSGDESSSFIRSRAGFIDIHTIRRRYDSFRSSVGAYSMNSSRMTTETDEYWKICRKKSIPANIAGLEGNSNDGGEISCHQFSILGQIHIDLARYHELGRFVETESDRKEMLNAEAREGHAPCNYDKQSAIFHLDIARRCGILEAILTTAHIVLDMPHELLKDVSVKDLFPAGMEGNTGIKDVEEFGSDLMEIAAEMGEKGAMLYMAQAYETGQRLGPNRSTDYKKAIEWYQRILGFQEDEEDNKTNEDVCKSTFSSFSPLTRHEILAKMAEMYKEGGYGLNQDFERAYNLFNEAAEAAMEAMHGKLATKYYEKAEMCA